MRKFKCLVLKSVSHKRLARALVLLAFFSAPHTAHALTATSNAHGITDARTNAQLAVERNRNDKSEACANSGMLYGPAYAGAKDANGCVTSFKLNTNGTISFTGPVSAPAPTTGTDLTTKNYVDSKTITCDASNSQTVRYNGANIQYCNGATWQNLVSVDTTPDPIVFTDQTGVATNSTVSSNAINVLNFTGPLTAVCGTGCTNIARNGAWSGATTLDGFMSGDTIAIRQVASGTPGVVTTATVAVGSLTSATWSVTSAPPCPNVQTFNTSGAFTWTKPGCGTNVTIECWGGGGGSNGSFGGGGGGYKTTTVAKSSLGATESGSVGIGGARNDGGFAQQGGNTTFGAIVTAYGGGGASGDVGGGCSGVSHIYGGGGGGATGQGNAQMGGAGGGGVGSDGGPGGNGTGTGGGGGNGYGSCSGGFDAGGNGAGGGAGGGGSPNGNGSMGAGGHAGGNGGGVWPGGGGRNSNGGVGGCIVTTN